MGLILFGHTGGHALIPEAFNPILPKQLGVAFFVFATAFTLANEKRPPLQVIYNRFFEVAVLGILLAVLVSVVQYIRIGDLNESNYLPFLLGANVFWENAFPANPTTWYVGTYFHLLVAWAFVLRYLPSQWFVLPVILVLDIGTRAVFIHANRDSTAYMILTSWLTVFFLGTLAGRRVAEGKLPLPGLAGPLSSAGMRRSVGISVLVCLLAGWLTVVNYVGISQANPFGRIPAGSPAISSLATSASATAQYSCYTLLLLAIVYGLPAGRFVRFLSQNTLLVFLAHMPFRDLVTPLYYPWISNGWVRQLANFWVLFVLLAVMSVVLRRVLRLSASRVTLGRLLFGDGYAAKPAAARPEATGVLS